MNRPVKYHINDGVLGWVYAEKDTEAYFDKLEAEAERLREAIGLVTTAIPDMIIDVNDPMGMMQKVMVEINDLKDQIHMGRAEYLAQKGIVKGACKDADEAEAELYKCRAEVKRLKDKKTERAIVLHTAKNRIENVEAEVKRLQKGISVSVEYCAVCYCEEHHDWRIPGYIFGCGGRHD